MLELFGFTSPPNFPIASRDSFEIGTIGANGNGTTWLTTTPRPLICTMASGAFGTISFTACATSTVLRLTVPSAMGVCSTARAHGSRLRVRGAHIEDIPAERVAQQFRPGERAEERNLGFADQQQGCSASRRTDIGQPGKHVVLDEFVGVGLAAVWLVAVIECAQFHPMAIDAVVGVQCIEARPCTLVHLDAKLRSGPLKPADWSSTIRFS